MVNNRQALVERLDKQCGGKWNCHKWQCSKHYQASITKFIEVARLFMYPAAF
jgi:hypothetical protein